MFNNKIHTQGQNTLAQKYNSKNCILFELAGNPEHFSGIHNFDLSSLKEIGLDQIFSLFTRTKHHHLFNTTEELEIYKQEKFCRGPTMLQLQGTFQHIDGWQMASGDKSFSLKDNHIYKVTKPEHNPHCNCKIRFS